MSLQINNEDFDSKRELIKRMFCQKATDDELELFMHACKRSGLDPFMKQIYAIKRRAKKPDGSWGENMTIQTGIDGFRLLADRSGNYSPGRESTFTYDDRNAIVSATSYVKKRTADGTWHEVMATAYMDEYRADQGLWNKMPRTMLAKCAEALALRKAFPAELSGLYTSEEMSQADATQVNHSTGEIKNAEVVVEDLTPINFDQEQIINLWVQKYPERLPTLLKKYDVDEIRDIPAYAYNHIVNVFQAYEKSLSEKK